MLKLRSLLASGYFPRELPPPFTTTTFARYAAMHSAALSRASNWTTCVSHNLARPGGLRRQLRIPNPTAYLSLAQTISTNWAAIFAHTWGNRLSTSRPYLMKDSDRAVVPRYRLAERPRLRALRRRAARYILVTDIDQFYHSIYTHAIPWALHTKAVSKAALKTRGKKKPQLFGDVLDKALRAMNDGQTRGIPIGPDTSLVIAEILLAAADAELLKRCGSRFKGFRHVDDYELSFESLSAAEATLAELQAILASFELVLNPRKTHILQLPRGFDSEWVIELKSIGIRSAMSPVAQRNDLLNFFSRAFALASLHPSDAVLKYAVAHVQGVNINNAAWRAFHNCLLSASCADASTLPVVLGTLYEVAHRGSHDVPLAPLSEVLESIIARHAQRAQGSEVAWALWGALAWGITLSHDAAHNISTMEDDICALLAMHANARRLFPNGALDTSLWKSLVEQPHALSGEHWLLAYEANRQGWLQAPTVASDPIFGAMTRAGVSFYDRTKVKPQFPLAGKAIPGGSLYDGYA